MEAFIIFRDRVTYARRCYAALEAAGLSVRIVDHGSTWEPACRWLEELEGSGTPVLRRKGNAWPWELWDWPLFRDIMEGTTEPYVVTDPDVIPCGGCPADWPQYAAAVLARHPGVVKVGLGLRLDKIPIQRPDRAGILKWEAPFWKDQAEPGVYRANTDTTLAVYRPWAEYPLFSIGPALRLGFPYVADHLGWYEMPPLGEELDYYRRNGDSGHHVPGRVLRD